MGQVSDVLTAEFPVYTGINREARAQQRAIERVPCIHRDKPPKDKAYKVADRSSLYTQG